MRNVITTKVKPGILTCDAFPRAKGRHEVICSLVRPDGSVSFASHGIWPSKEIAMEVAKDVQKLWKNPYPQVCKKCGAKIYGVLTPVKCPKCGKPWEDKNPKNKKLLALATVLPFIPPNPIRYVDGYKWGKHGKAYKSRKKAVRQMRAAFASGYRSNPIKSIMSLAALYLIIDGVASLIVFRDQPAFPNQAVRVGRTVIGLYLLGKG